MYCDSTNYAAVLPTGVLETIVWGTKSRLTLRRQVGLGNGYSAKVHTKMFLKL